MNPTNLAKISRDFLKLYGVYRYRMKRICDMDDAEAIQKCHRYYEENSLLDEWLKFVGESDELEV